MSRHLAWIYRSFGTVAKIRTACCGKLPVSHWVDSHTSSGIRPRYCEAKQTLKQSDSIIFEDQNGRYKAPHERSCHIADNSAVLNLVCSPTLDIRKRLRHDHLTSSKSILNCVMNRDRFGPWFNHRCSTPIRESSF
jgi:hypothetical protein